MIGTKLPFGLKRYRVGFLAGGEVKAMEVEVVAKNRRQAETLGLRKMGVIVHNCSELFYCKKSK